jgi:hypothetical protein
MVPLRVEVDALIFLEVVDRTPVWTALTCPALPFACVPACLDRKQQYNELEVTNRAGKRPASTSERSSWRILPQP